MQMRADENKYYYDYHAIVKHGAGHVVVRPPDVSDELWLLMAKRGCEILNKADKHKSAMIDAALNTGGSDD